MLAGHSSRLAGGLRKLLLGPGRPGEAAWEAVEELLLAADVGPLAAAELTAAARERAGREAERGGDPRAALATEVAARLARAPNVAFAIGTTPAVVLVVGANGSGKTTTAARLAHRIAAMGHSVVLAAADTYRAAATEQLRIWADRLAVPIVAQRPGADPGAVAFDAVAAARARNLDVVIVDTAGRLQTETNLMAELAKVRRVVERQLPGQPSHVLLVIDATTGQNGLAQAAAFQDEVGVTGIVLTKMDGSARGGIAVAIADRFRIPVQFIGTGEELTDLAPFDLGAYVEWLMAPGG